MPPSEDDREKQAREQAEKIAAEVERDEAVAAVPDEYVDEVALVGPPDRIRDRLQAWKEAGKNKHVGAMLIGGGGRKAFELLAEELL